MTKKKAVKLIAEYHAITLKEAEEIYNQVKENLGLEKLEKYITGIDEFYIKMSQYDD